MAALPAGYESAILLLENFRISAVPVTSLDAELTFTAYKLKLGDEHHNFILASLETVLSVTAHGECFFIICLFRERFLPKPFYLSFHTALRLKRLKLKRFKRPVSEKQFLRTLSMAFGSRGSLNFTQPKI